MNKVGLFEYQVKMNLMEWCIEREMVVLFNCEKQMYWRYLSEQIAEVLFISVYLEMFVYLLWMVYLLVESVWTMGVFYLNIVYFELIEVQRYRMVVRDD